MEDDLVQKIQPNAKYQQLVARRSRFGWTLGWMMMVVYYGFVLLIAFDKEMMSRKLGAGVMTRGMPIALIVIIFTVAMTGIYVVRANGEFDTLNAQIRQEVL